MRILNYATWSQFEPRDSYSVTITNGQIVSAVLVAAHYYDGRIDYEYHNEYPHEYRYKDDHYYHRDYEDTKTNAAIGTYSYGAGNPWQG